MKFASKNRWLIVAVAHYATLFIFTQFNYYLAPWGINIIITGMLIAFSSLVLNHIQGSLSLIPIALFLDSASPLPFGASLITLIGLHYIAVIMRYQFRRESAGISLGVSLVSNVAIHLVYSFFAVSYLGTNSLDPVQMGMNLLASSAAIAILNAHYFRVIVEILGLFGINIAQEQRQSR